jgi:hypothetical protein
MNKKYSLPRPPECTPTLYGTDENVDLYESLVFAHYYIGSADWYILEYSANEDIAFCWAEIIPGMGEFGYSSLSEMETLEVKQIVIIDNAANEIPVSVTYESHWQPRTLRKCLEKR